ncbi:MAG TPA: LacI family transcriptional regulator [Clostridiales bacterium]|nr:LacI family transcriptional regulator [Clostridiales bacterium]
MSTIKDVAKKAGVAISTVSNVINNIDVVSPRTRERVLQAIKELDYTPNLNGRHLKSSRTGFLGLFITSVEGPYYASLADSIYKECCKFGYGLNININGLNNLPQTEQFIFGKKVDGAIILNDTINDEHVEKFIKLKIPVVFVDREVADETVSSVVVDNRQGAVMVTEYLIKLGHRRIGYIHGYLNNYDDVKRYEGFSETMQNFKLPIREEDELVGYFSEQGAYNAVRERLRKYGHPPEAFFCANDLMAIGCIKALKDEGYYVPNDVSVVGFDDIDIAQYLHPSLTTVVNPVKTVGSLAVKNLVDIIQYQKGGRVTKLETTLLLRNSCKINL